LFLWQDWHFFSHRAQGWMTSWLPWSPAPSSLSDWSMLCPSPPLPKSCSFLYFLSGAPWWVTLWRRRYHLFFTVLPHCSQRTSPPVLCMFKMCWKTMKMRLNLISRFSLLNIWKSTLPSVFKKEYHEDKYTRYPQWLVPSEIEYVHRNAKWSTSKTNQKWRILEKNSRPVTNIEILLANK